MQIKYNKQIRTTSTFYQVVHLIQRQWFNGILIYLAIHVISNKNINISFGFDENPAVATEMSLVSSPQFKTATPPPPKKKGGGAGFSISNLTPILSPDYGERKGIPRSVIKAKLKVSKDYVKRYAPIAIKEMDNYGIPASITLAQGLLESNAGESKLALESMNHFGIKCRSKCKGCTCRNYTDDDVYDMFRVFDNVLESYREHSLLLSNSGRYRKLFQLDQKDYEGWAHGLKAAGYATDKRYAFKLIQIIEELKLYKYDI